MKRIKYPLVRPYIEESGLKTAVEILRSGWLTQGEYVERLEQKLRLFNKARYAFVLNSATSGLVASLLSLDLKEDDEVIVPAFTFPATANAVILARAKPVFCDIDLWTFNINPYKIEDLITKRTRAIMPVHEFGLSADMGNIAKIANRHNLSIIEDAACSLGAEYDGKRVGGFGEVGVFSFHPRKIITSGEGGGVITDNHRIAKRIGYLRNHGEWNRRFVSYGYNFRLSDFQAAILLSQINKIEKLIRQRIQLARHYNELLEPLEDKEMLRTPFHPENCRHIYQSYVILLAKKINRDRLKTLLKDKGIETQFGTYCLPLLDFYKKNFNVPKEWYRNSYYAYRHTLTLPLYHTLSHRQQGQIVKELTKAIKRCAG